VDQVDLKRSASRQARRRKIAVQSRRGGDGKLLALHRALARRNLPKGWLATTLGIPILISFGVLLSSALVLGAWHELLVYLSGALELGAKLTGSQYLGGVRMPFEIPWLDLPVGAPTILQWWIGFGVTAALAITSFVLPVPWIPLAYGLRLLAIVMASSLAYFQIMPASFPYSIADHVGALLVGWLLLAVTTPMIYGLTYNVLGFKPISRYLLLGIALGFMLITAPLLSLAHTIILLHGSLLYQPVLFLFFGLFPGLTAMIAFYSWAMTWEPDAHNGAVL
jgi:hypothetical protein